MHNTNNMCSSSLVEGERLGRGWEEETTHITGLDVVATGTLRKKNKNDSTIKDFEELFHCFHIESF